MTLAQTIANKAIQTYPEDEHMREAYADGYIDGIFHGPTEKEIEECAQILYYLSEGLIRPKGTKIEEWGILHEFEKSIKRTQAATLLTAVAKANQRGL